MDFNLLMIFILLNITNVIIQTVKSLCTIKCGKGVAAVVNAVAYGLYTVVLVYTVCELPLVVKALVVAICNLIGVYIVKLFEERARKDKLWKIEMTISPSYKDTMIRMLEELNISYNWIDLNKYFIFNVYSNTQKESTMVKMIADKCKAKYFVSESKIL